MINIARENNFSATAFIVHDAKSRYSLCWITLGGGLDLYGHATLASAYAAMNFYDDVLYDADTILS